MKKILIITSLALLFVLLLSSTASAVIFDIEEARQEEWDRYESYRNDYLKYNDLEAYDKYINNYNLERNFGFNGPDYYYIPPDVLQAKYNPPLQGDSYYTANRGYGSSLTHQPSAYEYKEGYRVSNVNGVYFDHPQIYGPTYPDPAGSGPYGHLTLGSNTAYYGGNPLYGGYGTYGNLYGYQPQPNMGYGGYGYPGGYPGGGGYPYGNNYGYGYNYGDGEEPAYYARLAEPWNNGFYVLGYY